jgi:DNA-directed RNA polymerase beta subunit
MTSLLGLTSGGPVGGLPKSPLGGGLQPNEQRDDLRDITDPKTTRSWIYDNVYNAASNLKPVQNKRHTLRLSKPYWEGPENFSIKERKKALLSRQTLNRRLRGTWELLDNATGDVLDKREMTVAAVPVMTDAGTFIHRGNEYTLGSQQRMRSGIFARVKNNGEVESHVNVLPGQGVAHRYFLDPKKGIFKSRISQAEIPLLPLLRAMGASDKQIQEAWGNELYKANVLADQPAALSKYYERLVRDKSDDDDETTRREKIVNAVRSMKLDPEISQRNLGKPYEKLDLDVILDATKKLAAISRGEAEVDDRDHLFNMNILGPEDLFGERIAKDYGRMQANLLKQISFRGKLDRMQPGALTKQIESVLLNSGLAQPLEEINPADVFDKVSRVTRMGEGGINSTDSIPDESRNVQPSHFMFLDPVRTPECYSEDTEVMTESGWKPWPAVTYSDKLACLIDGRLEFRKPDKLMVYDYSGVMYGAETARLSYLVTPDHRMYVRKGHDTPLWGFEYAEKTHNSHSRLFMCGGHAPFVPDSPCDPGLPSFNVGVNNRKAVMLSPEQLDDWAEFVGWFLSEGSSFGNEQRKNYGITISQCSAASPENYRRIEALLSRLPFASYSNKRCFIVGRRHLYDWAKPFGLCHEKYLPDCVWSWPVSMRQRLLEGLLLGDGRRAVKGSKKGERTQFCSTSRQLAYDVQKLLFSLGVSSRVVFEPDEREDRYFGCHVVHIHDRNTRVVSRAKPGAKNPWSRQHRFFTQDYSGKVYCASVPGGLVYVRRNEKTGFWCGNSQRAGVDLFFSGALKKGKDGRIYAPFKEAKTGKLVYRSPQDVADLAIMVPGQEKSENKRVFAMKGGRMRLVPKDEVDLVPPHFENAFSPLGNMVPMKSAVKAQRMAMASRMLTQALPIVSPQAPLVQTGIPGSKESYEAKYGDRMGAVRATGPGTVLSVDNDSVVIRDQDGNKQTVELYNNFPYNRKTFAHNTPLVKPGDRVQQGQLLARSNFTDDKGVTALGRNARVAYVPFRGLNFEDAIVVSESFSKAMTSEHMYQNNLEIDDKYKLGKNDFVSLFGGKFEKNQLEKMDNAGVVKEGMEIKYGDPLILAARQRPIGEHRVWKRKAQGYEDRTVTWQHRHPGVVTDVVKGKKGISVVVKSHNPMQVGDKLSGRYGDKGIIADIIPDDQMPQGTDGKPFEILLNPHGVISRTNPAQVMEAVLGMIAEKRGEPIAVPDFDEIKDLASWTHEMARKEGIIDQQKIIDPETGRAIPPVLVGNRFFLKLHHMAEDKGSGRATGGYTMEGAPAKGGSSGSKRLSLLDTNALISHGAYENIRDAKLIRGQKNEDYWLSFLQGHNPPDPDVPFVYEKFVNELKGAGVNVVKDGNQLNVMALTQNDAKQLTGDREIENAETVNWDNEMKAVKGGLFDPSLTGGHHGNRWSYIKLHQPLPNPVMEEPIRRLLGLTEKKFKAILAGEDSIDGESGPAAIQKALEGFNVDRQIKIARQQIAGSRKSDRDAAVRKLGYLQGLQKTGQKPSDWLLDRVPVLPPKFRPISKMEESGTPLVSDANFLYKEVFEANKNWKEMSQEVSDVGDEQLAAYQAFKAVTGLADPIHPKLQEKRVKGFLKSIFGDSPKFGCFDDKTEILTRRGWLLFEDLNYSDEVMTLNPGTGYAEWGVIRHIHRYEYVGEMFRFETARGLDMVVTPNHRNWVRNRRKGLNPDDMNSGWHFEPAYKTAACRNRRWFRTAADGWVGTFQRPDFLPDSCSDEDFAAYVGWWVAEGWLGDRKADRPQICQAVKQKEYCEELDRIHQSLGFAYSVGDYDRKVPSGGTCLARQWSVNSPELAAWLVTHCGKLAKEKKLSDVVKNWPTELLKAFLLGYARGDGNKRHVARRNAGGVTHKNKTQWWQEHQSMATTSISLADDLVEVGNKLGLTFRVRVSREETVFPDGTVFNTLYRVKTDSSRFVVAEGSIESVVDYEGYVYCVSVDNGVVLVRRNGKPFYSGNSVQRKLLSTPVDVVGRAVIGPDPDLDMDSVGLPEAKAWDVYSDFVARRLVRRGLPPSEALKQVEERTPTAKTELLAEMENRPVFISRAPVLHRFGVMAFKPKLVKGDVMKVSPLIVGGFNADFDGDTMNYHVPVKESARKEALERMLPSRNLLSPADFKSPMAKPSQEYVAGLFSATEKPDEKARPHYFKDAQSAIAAYQRGDIPVNAVVNILNK